MSHVSEPSDIEIEGDGFLPIQAWARDGSDSESVDQILHFEQAGG